MVWDLDRRFSVAGVFQGVPGFLKQQPLARIHKLGFDGRDFEEEGIELADARNAATGPGGSLTLVDGTSRSPIRVVAVELPPVEAIVGERGHGVLTIDQHLPHVVDRTCLREATTHADDGDGLFFSTPGRGGDRMGSSGKLPPLPGTGVGADVGCPLAAAQRGLAPG